MQKECVICGNSFQARYQHARMCSQSCRQKSSRQKRKPAPFIIPALGRPLSACGGVLDIVKRELSAAGKLDTTLGQTAIVIAARLDSEGLDTAAGTASLSKELRAVMSELLQPVAAVTDSLDELRVRRDAKRSTNS